jgi:hypothetical protein
LVRQKLLIGRVEDDYFPDARLLHLSNPSHERLEMQIADGTTCKTTELEMCNFPLWFREYISNLTKYPPETSATFMKLLDTFLWRFH